MRLLAALAAGVSVFLSVAHLTGHGGSLRLRMPGGRRRSRIPRGVWLRQAGVEVSPAQFWAVSVVVGLAVELLMWAVSGSPFVGAVPAVAAAFGPRAYFSHRRDVRLRAVVNAWPDGIRHLLANVEARRTLHQSILELNRSGPAPVAEAFLSYPGTAILAGPVAALELVREELSDHTSDWVIEVLIAAHEQGQALSLRILRDLSRQVTEDLKADEEIKTSQLEPKMTARIAFVIPWIGLALLCASTPDFREFYRTSQGATVVALGGILSVLGLAVSRRLSSELVDARVLGTAEGASS